MLKTLYVGYHLERKFCKIKNMKETFIVIKGAYRNPLDNTFFVEICRVEEDIFNLSSAYFVIVKYRHDTEFSNYKSFKSVSVHKNESDALRDKYDIEEDYRKNCGLERKGIPWCGKNNQLDEVEVVKLKIKDHRKENLFKYLYHLLFKY